MEWWQTLLVAVTTYAVTKTVDHFILISQHKHEFNKKKIDKIYNEIEDLKDEVGRMYELSANWKNYESKAGLYDEAFSKDDYLVGKFNKYPEIAGAARDAIHYCKIVAYNEREHVLDMIETKDELSEKYQMFLSVCNSYVEKLV